MLIPLRVPDSTLALKPVDFRIQDFEAVTLKRDYNREQDNVLVRALKAGDIDAFEALIRRYASVIFKLARGRDETEAQEMYQVADDFISYTWRYRLDIPSGYELQGVRFMGYIINGFATRQIGKIVLQ